MAPDNTASSRSRLLRPLGGIGGRAATLALRPVADVVGVAVGAGMTLERRAVDRVLDSGELERILVATLDDPRVQATVQRALDSDGAKRVIDGFFDSGLFDQFIDRLAASDALWRLVDEIAASPAVMAAVSQQGLGFADQVGSAVRQRSRKADRRVERAVARLAPPDQRRRSSPRRSTAHRSGPGR